MTHEEKSLNEWAGRLIGWELYNGYWWLDGERVCSEDDWNPCHDLNQAKLVEDEIEQRGLTLEYFGNILDYALTPDSISPSLLRSLNEDGYSNMLKALFGAQYGARKMTGRQIIEAAMKAVEKKEV